MLPEEFMLPFDGKLDKNNRWVILAKMIPWWEFEDDYAQNFKEKRKGEEAFGIRVALGTLLIKEKLGVSDEELVQQIAENPYLQYFLGFQEFNPKRPFTQPIVTYFRKRFDAGILNKVNERISREDTRTKKDDNSNEPSCGNHNDTEKEKGNGKEDKKVNLGKMLLDATCAPADIQYPTDTRLLNDAREKLEEIIDVLHVPDKGKVRRPRTHRNKARKAYLAFAKVRKPNTIKIKKMKMKLIRYIRRNLRIVEILANRNGLEILNRRQYSSLLVIKELYRQQLLMMQNKVKRVDDRIVSIAQPHVRPIVRGKASSNVEFGAKLSVSMVNGFVFCEKLEWDAYNEGNTLIAAAERYKAKYGYYPEAILADKIYRTRPNLDFCKLNGIRLSGPKLGRSSEEEKQSAKHHAKNDSSQRNAVEGKFGEGKRKYTLNKIMTRLKETSESTIILNLIVMNLEKRLRLLLYKFIFRFFHPLLFRIYRYYVTRDAGWAIV
jgi:hypothetical protein